MVVGVRDLLEGGKLAWDNRSSIRAALAAIRHWWKKRKVLLIGPGGTGKTTLARLLAGEIDWLTDAPWDYSESYVVERLRMKRNQSVEVVVTPGQKDRRPSTWADVQADVAAGRYKGIILVSAYGHHSLSGFGLKAVAPGLSKDQALREYLASCRLDELTVLRQVGDFLAACPKRVWLLSAVTKQDLWYPDDGEVRAHYSSGEYARLVQAIATRKDARLFRHECAYASLLIGNYTAARNEVLKKNVAGYDQRMQVESVRRLFNAIAQLIAWEVE